MKRKKFRVRCVLIGILCLFMLFVKSDIYAAVNREVKVAFFPMEGYHTVNADGSCGGMDVDYLKELSEYAHWKVTYVKCDSWEDALQMLQDKQVDLVGSAQYSKERAEIFRYADLSSGYTFGVIATNSNSTIAYEDFTMMQQITYGVVKDYVRKTEFLQYLHDNGVEDPVICEYDTTAELQDALDKGEIDALVHTFTEVEEGQRLIGRFAPKPFYYITYKDNEDIMRELNQAAADLKMNQPQLEMQLMNKYYYNKFDKTALLTTDEILFAEERKTVVVGYLDGLYPFSYEENGEFKGLSRELMDECMKTSGLVPEYRKVKNNVHGREQLANGNIDILAYCIATQEMLNEYHLKNICQYANTPLVLAVDKSQNHGNIRKIVTIQPMVNKAKEALQEDGVEIVTKETQKECVEAVKSGEAEAMVCDGYLIEHLRRTNFRYSGFRIERVLNVDCIISLAVREEDVTLAAILEKTMGIIKEKDINAYLLKENRYPLINMGDYLRENSIKIMGVLLTIIILIIAVSVHSINDSKKIQKLMYKDTKMDIWNVNYLIYKGEQSLLLDHKIKYAVVYVKLRHFTRYTIVNGWNAGERLLENVADLLKRHMDEKKEICARSQGDRFALLLQYTEQDELLERVQTLKREVEQWTLNHTGSHMILQSGICYVPQEKGDLRIAVNDANQALEYMGDLQETGIQIYDAVLEQKMKEQHAREKVLETADIYQDFVTYYQPKTDIRSGKIVGAEALIRFLDPMDGRRVKAPGYFVPYYEQTGKITEIDFFVCETVCKMLRRRLDAGLPVVPVSCNFSRRHFQKTGFAERFTELLDRYQISRDLVEVEITETLIMEEYQQKSIKKILDVLKEQGIRLSIDDFGAGYSSLGILEKIPASVIKLDRAFFVNQEDHDRQKKVMRGIMKMAEELEVQTVCEGVETEADIHLMQEIGATVAQGYYYFKPISEDEFESKLGEVNAH